MALPEPLNIAGFRLAFRQVVVDGRAYAAPRGVGRNNRNKSWQVKLDRGDTRLVAGNFGDQTFEGTENSLVEAIKFLVRFLRKEEAKGSSLSISSHEGSRSVPVAPDVRLNWTTIHQVEHLSVMLYLPEPGKTKVIYAGSALKLDTPRVIEALNKALSLKQAVENKSITQAQALSTPHEDIEQAIERRAILEILQRDEIKRLLARTGGYRAQAQALKEQKKRARLEEKRARENGKLAG